MKYSSLKQALQFIIILLLSGTMIISCDSNRKSTTTEQAKVYEANEEGGSVSVIDSQDIQKNTSIDLSDSGKMFMAHNVQVSPNGKSVWVTA